MPIDEKTGKWIYSDCYMKAMGKSDCSGHIHLVDVELIPEKFHDRNGGARLITPAHLKRTFACDSCGYIYEQEDLVERKWV